MSVSEIVGWSGGGVLLLMTLIQIAPIKWNPWSCLAKMLGRAINAEVLGEITNIKRTQTEVQEKLEEHIQDDDERDKLMRGENYTHEYFTDMLQDIDDYEGYCKTHPGYKNNRARLAIENIKRVYDEHARKGDFLGGV